MWRSLVSVGLGLLLGRPLLQAQALPAPLAVDPSTREESRQFFLTFYARSEGVSPHWTGNMAAGNAGDTATAFREAVRLRINYFRALAGVPAGVALNATYSAKAQQAALMMSANGQISARPPSSWTFYSAAGAEAAGSSNLWLGQLGAEAITAYLRGEGDGNAALAQRRGLLYPWTRAMGTGDVPATGDRRAANATWVVDAASDTGPRPTVRDGFVAWPPRGFVPYPFVFPRWSFSYPGADFSAASVTMTRNEAVLAVRLEPVANGSGENTLVWIYDNADARVAVAHPKPAEDVPYEVKITGVRGTGVPTSFSYGVTVFDPEVAEIGIQLPLIGGSITPALGAASPYNFVKPALAVTFDWRVLQFTPFMGVFGAEGDLQGVQATTTGTYAARDTMRAASGSAAYRLAHDTAEAQVLQLPGSYFSPVGATGELSFRSLLGLAATTQTARVQVALDDGDAWRDVWTQAGSGGAGETTFNARTVSLADFGGRTLRVRFVFSVDEKKLDGPGGPVGWLIDDITLKGTRLVVAGPVARVANGSVLRFTPSVVGAVGLQARGVTLSAHTMEWGPVLQVVPVGADGSGDPGRLSNLAIRTQAGTGPQTLIMGMAIGGTGARGSKPMLIRGVGPSLGAFGVPGLLADPLLAVLSSSVILVSNDNWSNDAQVAALTPQVGAFPLASATSRDAALVTVLAAGSYTVQITGAGGATGVALAEVYDGTPAGGFIATTPRLTNVSARAQVGTGGDILIAGFTIGGTTEKTLLLRAVGPTLGGFGVTGVLADPKLELYSAVSRLLVANDNWVPTATLAAATSSVGAFVLPAGSRDASFLITLPPGSYTAQVSGVGTTTGVALVEVYEVP